MDATPMPGSAVSVARDVARPLVEVNFVTYLDAGHRANYEVVLERVLADQGMVRAKAPSKGSCDLFPMIDDGVFDFTVLAVRNALRGRRTVGLFFRSAECFRTDQWKYRVKFVLFALLRRIPGVSLLTILPYVVEPRFARVSSDYIYDLQLWDLGVLDLQDGAQAPAWVDDLRARAGGRRIVLALGEQSRLKGFELFARVWNDFPAVRERFLFVSAGRVAPECARLADRFQADGGVVVDRYVSDAEIGALYERADIVWSCYPPDYNQASGIFGRAFQLGKPTIVRAGSLLVALAADLGQPILEFDFGGAAANAAALLGWAPAAVDRSRLAARVAAIRDASVGKLLRALGR